MVLIHVRATFDSLFLCACLATFGCQKNSAPLPVAPVAPSVSSIGQGSKPKIEVPPFGVELLDQAEKHFDDGQLAEMAKILDDLAEKQEQLAEEQADRLVALRGKFKAEQARIAAEERAKSLADAEKMLVDGKLDDARRMFEVVLAKGPTAEERDAANAGKVKIDERYRARRKLQTAMRLLASSNRGEVRDAKEQLWGDIEAAFPLLMEATQSDNPVLVANTLDMLRTLNQPARTTPIMLAVLSRSQQSASWPAAIREIQRLNHPGAGEALLALALSSQASEQRIAALTGLAGVVDPPSPSLIALLPIIYAGGPELAATLQAAAHAVTVHRQTDLLARRGIDVQLTGEQEQQLAGLAERLAAIAGSAASEKPASAASHGAMALAVATRLVDPQPLTGIKVDRVSAEEATSPGTAVLDGVWNVATPDKLWRYPLGGQAAIVLDLGSERTVSGVRIWNYNEQGAGHRGWKEVDIFVSSSPALLSPIATGVVPAAPGAANPPDYSVLLTIPLTRGRYVKLQPRSIWREESVSGLSEVQILGF